MLAPFLHFVYLTSGYLSYSIHICTLLHNERFVQDPLGASNSGQPWQWFRCGQWSCCWHVIANSFCFPLANLYLLFPYLFYLWSTSILLLVSHPRMKPWAKGLPMSSKDVQVYCVSIHWAWGYYYGFVYSNKYTWSYGCFCGLQCQKDDLIYEQLLLSCSIKVSKLLHVIMIIYFKTNINIMCLYIADRRKWTMNLAVKEWWFMTILGSYVLFWKLLHIVNFMHFCFFEFTLTYKIRHEML